MRVAKRPANHSDRTRKYYEALGYTVGRADCTGSRRRPSHDLFGIADFVGFDLGSVGGGAWEDVYELHCVLIQQTDSTSHSKHRKKILASDKALTLARRFWRTELRIEIISWGKKADGKYHPRVESIMPLLIEELGGARALSLAELK
jgi:hypothetical protein